MEEVLSRLMVLYSAVVIHNNIQQIMKFFLSVILFVHLVIWICFIIDIGILYSSLSFMHLAPK